MTMPPVNPAPYNQYNPSIQHLHPQSHFHNSSNNLDVMAAGFPQGSNDIPLQPPQPQVDMYKQYPQVDLIMEKVEIPDDMKEFALNPPFMQILLRVKEQTKVNCITMNKSEDGQDVESVSIEAPSPDSAQLARTLIETHFKSQRKIKSAEERLYKYQSDLFAAQGDIASGITVDFNVDKELIGLIIGKKGARIKQIETETGLSSIQVNSETGNIRIFGPNTVAVNRARELLELKEECFDLESHYLDWLGDRYNSAVLNDIKSASNLMVTRIDYDRNGLVVVGIASAVRTSRIMLSTQLEYIDKQIDLHNAERNTREALTSMRQQYGMQSNYNQRDGDSKKTHGPPRDRGKAREYTDSAGKVQGKVQNESEQPISSPNPKRSGRDRPQGSRAERQTNSLVNLSSQETKLAKSDEKISFTSKSIAISTPGSSNVNPSKTNGFEIVSPDTSSSAAADKLVADALAAAEAAVAVAATSSSKENGKRTKEKKENNNESTKERSSSRGEGVNSSDQKKKKKEKTSQQEKLNEDISKKGKEANNPKGKQALKTVTETPPKQSVELMGKIQKVKEQKERRKNAEESATGDSLLLVQAGIQQISLNKGEVEEKKAVQPVSKSRRRRGKTDSI